MSKKYLHIKRPMFVLGVFVLFDVITSLFFIRNNIEILLFLKLIIYSLIIIASLIYLKFVKPIKYESLGLYNIIILVSILLVFSAVTIYRYYNYVAPQFDCTNKNVSIVATVEENNKSNYIVKINESDDSSLINKKILINNYNAKIKVGDIIRVKANFEKITNKSDFNSQDYYNSKNVFIMSKVDKVNVIGINKNISYHFNNMKTYMENSIYNIFPKDEGDIVNSLIFGTDGVISEEYDNTITEVGLSHIFSISGLHIAIVGMFLIYILDIFKFGKIKNFIVILFVVLYMFLVGNTPSISRAVIMFILVLLGNNLNRYSDMLSNIAFAFTIAVLTNPYIVYSVGFMLTFIAVLSIAVTHKPINRITTKYFKSKILKVVVTTFLMSLAISLFTMPIIGYYFNSFNILSPIVNIFIVPLIVPIIILGIIVIIFSTLKLILIAKIVGLPLGILVTVMINLTRMSGKILVLKIYLPDSTIFTSSLTVVVILVIYMLLYKKRLLTITLIMILMCNLIYINIYFKTVVDIIKLSDNKQSAIYVKSNNNNALIVNEMTYKSYNKIQKHLKRNNIKSINTVVFLSNGVKKVYGDNIVKDNNVKNVICNTKKKYNRVKKLNNIYYSFGNIDIRHNGNEKDFILDITVDGINISYTSGLVYEDGLENSDVIIDNSREVYIKEKIQGVNIR